ncbi:glutamate receptor ionotropic, kainate 4-like [Amphibalanus amphitrite]|uniref:glutamate receptor ionotropic, kainate 4-like n=1 Tax=Amphibalanus amphitrite TaxID=1232801 RepID=UPI001C90D8EB|nr:glutamate receptor ionotropic, kainate 4-like [Amphibalanus amphitrite]
MAVQRKLFLLWNSTAAPEQDDSWRQEINITAIHDPPYFSIKRLANGSHSFGGYMHDVWQIIAANMDLKYRIIPCPGGGYGVLDSNGTWNGMVGELASGRAHLALNGLFYNRQRTSVVDYVSSTPLDQQQISFFVRRGSRAMPTLSAELFAGLLTPLDNTVWWALLASMIVLWLALCVTLRLGDRRTQDPQSTNDLHWTLCPLFIYSTIVCQGWSIVPEVLSARTVTIFSWILGLIIYTSYTANLISHLAVDRMQRPINSLEEFSKLPDWSLAVEPGTSLISAWRYSHNPYERHLYSRVLDGKNLVYLNDSESAVQRVLRPRVLVVSPLNRLFHWLGTDGCHFVPLLDVEAYGKKPVFLALAKRKKKLRLALDRQLLRLKELGLLDELWRKWIDVDPSMCEVPSGYRAVSLTDLAAVVLVVVFGVVFSLVALAVELVVFRACHACRTARCRCVSRSGRAAMAAWGPEAKKGMKMRP